MENSQVNNAEGGREERKGAMFAKVEKRDKVIGINTRTEKVATVIILFIMFQKYIMHRLLGTCLTNRVKVCLSSIRSGEKRTFLLSRRGPGDLSGI